MAQVGNNAWPTLLDFASREDPDGKIAQLAELLHEKNEILDDIPFVEGNLPTGHKSTIRAGLPTPTWRKLNYGVQPTKGQSVQVVDTCGMLADLGEVDKKMADLNGNSAAWRLSEDAGHIEGIAQALAATLIYGDTDVYPERFMGIGPRYDDLSADNGEQIIDADAGGSGSDCTSIWLVGWGMNTVHGIFPKGSQAGLTMEDKGEVMLVDENGGKFPGYQTYYAQDVGLCVRDWRFIVRIANIDTGELTIDKSSNSADLEDLMVQASEQIWSLSGCRPIFYCNRGIRTWFRRQMLKDSNRNLSIMEYGGKKVMAFDEIPIRRVDQILNTEARIT